MRILEAKVDKNQAGVWCPYTLWMKTENQTRDGQRYRPSDYVGLVYSKTIENGGDHNKERALYFAEQGGYVSFFASDNHKKGFCGATFSLPTLQEDYSVVVENVVGPWSSDCSSMNRRGFVTSVEVHFEGNMAGHITLAKANEVLRDFNLPYHYEPLKNWNGHVRDPFCLVLYPN